MSPQPRKRLGERTQAISITLPRSMLDDIDDNLTRKQSRSAWIAKAIDARLKSKRVDLADSQIFMMALDRLPMKSTVRSLLYEHITTSTDEH